MPRHDPQDIAVLMDISGECTHCHHRGLARLVAYYDKTVLMRCYNCKMAGCFVPDDATFNDPQKFAPFLEDEDPPDAHLPGRHTRGIR